MQRVKNIDYDDDDLYSDEDETYDGDGAAYTTEDRENFATLTPVVRAELDEAGVPSTTKEIEDALWHYFWDVGKSVAYLKNARTPRQQGGAKEVKEKTVKPKSKFDEAAEKSKAKAGELNGFGFVGFARRHGGLEDYRGSLSGGKGGHILRSMLQGA